MVAGVGFFTDAYDIFAISIASTMLGYAYGNSVVSGTRALTPIAVAAGLHLTVVSRAPRAGRQPGPRYQGRHSGRHTRRAVAVRVASGYGGS